MVYERFEKAGRAIHLLEARGADRRLAEGAFPELAQDGASVVFGRGLPKPARGPAPWEAALYVLRISRLVQVARG